MRGYTWLGLSNDSTCTHQLFSHSAAYETLQLHSLKQPQRDSRSYSLPQWAQGHWESVSVKGGRLVYKSDEEFTSYSLETISSPHMDRYLVRLQTSCGHAAYTCLTLEQRTENIIELKLGKHGKSSHQRLCDPDNFLDKQWLTLGKAKVKTSCPLVGEFSGALPDAEGLCARSVTSCDRADQMNYQVYNCENTTEVYEDRSYHCYGAFEDDGLVYTVVKRLDLPYHECFVGTNLENGQSMITEAGTSCGRTKEPGTSGMLLSYRSDQCVEWQWEDTISEATHTVNNVVDIKHTPRIEIEVAVNTTTRASETVDELMEEITRTPKELMEHEIVIDDKKMIDVNITEVFSAAKFVKYNKVLVTLAFFCLMI